MKNILFWLLICGFLFSGCEKRPPVRKQAIRTTGLTAGYRPLFIPELSVSKSPARWQNF